MTKAQIYGDGRNGTQPGYFEMFRQICAVKGWKGTSIAMSAFRREWHVLAGLGRVSAKDIDRMRGFDALKASWLALVRPADLDAQMRMQAMPRTRLITRIQGMCHEDYWRALLQSARFKAHELEDLSETQLEQFRNTLAARLHASKSNSPATDEAEQMDTPDLSRRSPAQAEPDPVFADNQPF